MRVDGARDERIAAVADVQRGRVGHWQLRSIGITSNMIETRLRSGRLQRRRRGVYSVGHSAPAELTRETEALLACPDGTLLSHEAADALWRLRAPLRDREPIDILVHGTQTPCHPGIRAHRTIVLDVRDTRIERGLPTTSPARTFVDIAGRRTESELERALDDALRRNLLRLTQLVETIERVGGNRKGIGLIKTIVADRQTGSGLSRSNNELKLRRLLAAADLPTPDLNVKFDRYEPDMVWWEQRVIVEVDSWRWHGGRWSFEADRKRDATLIAEGWIILRFTARQIEREPYRVVAQIAAALAQRARFAA